MAEYEGSLVIASPSRNSEKNPRRANGGENPEFQRGIRFSPHDDELIIHYLNKKIKNEKLPHDKIKDVNVYKCHPAELVAKNDPVGDQEWYFFTSRDRKYQNGTRPNRAAKGGYWKATSSEKKVYYKRKHVGFRKGLVFYEGKHKKGTKTDWIMHEYTSHGPSRKREHAKDMKLDDWVLCKIYDKEERKGFRGMQSLYRDQESESISESEPEPEPLETAAPLSLNDKEGELCREIIAAPCNNNGDSFQYMGNEMGDFYGDLNQSAEFSNAVPTPMHANEPVASAAPLNNNNGDPYQYNMCNTGMNDPFQSAPPMNANNGISQQSQFQIPDNSFDLYNREFEFDPVSTFFTWDD